MNKRYERRYLFVDDGLIAKLDGVRRVVHPVQKAEGNPLIRPDIAQGERVAFLYGSVLYEDGTFRMWYESSRGAESSGQSASCVAYATSKDGYHWERPELGLIDWFGSKENNVVYTTGYKGNAYDASVIRDDDDPDPTRRYKMLHWDTWEKQSGLWLAYSPDGLRWTRYGDAPVWTGMGDVVPTVFDEQSGRFACYGKTHAVVGGGPRRRCVGIGFSDDAVHWETPAMLSGDAHGRTGQGNGFSTTAPPQGPAAILLPDEEDDAAVRAIGGERAEFYGMCGFPYAGMYLGLLWVFRVIKLNPASRGWDDGPFDVQLTYSTDGLDWKRTFERDPVIPLGPRGSFDDAIIVTVNRPLVLNDEIWIYYGAFNTTHGIDPILLTQSIPGADPQEWAELYSPAIGLGKIRLDGFVSVDGGHQEGRVTTVPVQCTGEKVVINADARGGTVIAELLGADGQPLPGFTRQDCRAFDGDAIRHVINWAGGTLRAHQGQELQLCFYLQNARLYSFTFHK